MAKTRNRPNAAIYSSLILGLAILGYLGWSFGQNYIDNNCNMALATTNDNTKLTLEIAKTDTELQKGLGGRNNLPAQHGMLFDLSSTPGIFPFWMKDTHFPLDIVWLNNNQVVEIATLPAVIDANNIPTHVPTQKATQVIEVNANEATVDGLTIGAKVQLDNKPCLFL